MTVTELRENLIRIDIPDIVFQLNKGYSDKFLHANHKQMWAGQKPDGSDITPSYLEDPFFKSRKQAEGYANWKLKITPNSQRNKYAPNLFINGYFYSTLKLDPKELRIYATNPLGAKVISGHEDAIGVSIENLEEIKKSGYMKDFIEHIEKITGLKFV